MRIGWYSNDFVHFSSSKSNNADDYSESTFEPTFSHKMKVSSSFMLKSFTGPQNLYFLIRFVSLYKLKIFRIGLVTIFYMLRMFKNSEKFSNLTHFRYKKFTTFG